jgi:putative ABC transport system permease protein
MIAVTLRGLATRKLRTALTAIAVVLGVALVTGTYLLTDTIDRSFDQTFSEANAGVDVTVHKRQAVSDQDPGTLPPSLVRRIAAIRGVAKAAGGVFGNARILDRHGKDVSSGGTPDFVSSQNPAPFSPFDYVDGHPPSTAGEVALDTKTAGKAGYHLGDSVPVAGLARPRDYRLVGVAKFGSTGSLAGASVAIMTRPEAQRVLDRRGGLDSIDVAADAGVSPAQLRDRVRAALQDPGVTVRTGSEEAAKQTSDIQGGFSFLRTILLVFGGIALFVGAFMIFNTFSITVAQRMREFALLRTLGASRRQVRRAVAGEALAVGLAASVVGLALGFALAPALRALLKAFGADLPTGGTVVEARTIIVALLVGILVTLIAAAAPARRATRVAPVAALTESALTADVQGSRRRTLVAAVIVLAGIGLMVAGLVGAGDVALVGAGAAIVFVAAALLAHHVVRPLASAIGRPLERLLGVSGRLARENSVRNPRRTASSASALMIGVALVAFVTIFAAGLKGSINRAVDQNFSGALVLESKSFNLPIPGGVPDAVRRVDGVGQVAAVSFNHVKIGKDRVGVSGVDAGALGSLYALTSGSVAPGGLAAKKSWAEDHGVKVGDTLSLLTPTGKRIRLKVGSLYDDQGQLLDDLTVPIDVLRRDFDDRAFDVVFIGAAPGAADTTVKDDVQAALDRQFPSVKVETKQGFKDEQASQINQILGLFYVLLSLSVIVSLFGIVTTLALTIHERTRELGLLRAIGTSRRQIRRVVRWEAVITAMIGAVIGVVLGVLFSIVVTRPLRSEGFHLVIPVAQLLLLLVLAGIAGTLAAIGPARRAARIDILRALAYE